MRMCPNHWQMFKDIIEKFGMTGLISSSTEELCERIEDIKENGEQPANFDPLSELNIYWTMHALQIGGAYLAGQPEDGSNDGHYCPLCEWKKNAANFDPYQATEIVVSDMAAYARKNKLIAGLS